MEETKTLGACEHKQTYQILCLANSNKHGGRCVAGLRTDGQGWIRPVSSRDDGTLRIWEYKLDNLEDPKVLDVLEIEVIQHNPKQHQPENWLISGKKWHLSRRLNVSTDKKAIVNFLNSSVVTNGMLFGCSNDRVPFSKFVSARSLSSLALVKPKNLSFRVTTYQERKKVRAGFFVNNVFYSLVVTDSALKNKLEQLDLGHYPINSLSLVDYDYSEIFLTISLGEPFKDGCCYKLVAGILFI